MLSESFYNFIACQLESAQQQNNNALNALADMREGTDNIVGEFGDHYSVENLNKEIDNSRNFISTFEIDNSMMNRMITALQNLFDVSSADCEEPDRFVLFFSDDYSIDDVILRPATTASLTTNPDGGVAVRVDTENTDYFPGIQLRAPTGLWDLSLWSQLVVVIRNIGSTEVVMGVRVDNLTGTGSQDSNTRILAVLPGESAPIKLRFDRKRYDHPELSPIGVIRNPKGVGSQTRMLDITNVYRIMLSVQLPTESHSFIVDTIYATIPYAQPDDQPTYGDHFYPFIDIFGQFKHKEWPNKVQSLSGLQDTIYSESLNNLIHPAPSNRDAYGGWTGGPSLTATGWFYTTKRDGKWWLVDPIGNLFWMHGVSTVREYHRTPITDRTEYFEDLPSSTGVMGVFYDTYPTAATRGYYATHYPYVTYDFGGSNLFYKYGVNWETLFPSQVNTRLTNWGINALGSVHLAIGRNINIPYYTRLFYTSTSLSASVSTWKQFPDVFHASFQTNVRASLDAQIGGSVDDPMCIGFTIDGELPWTESILWTEYDDLYLAIATLESPATQTAKIEFVSDLQTKYTLIGALNAVWGTAHASWAALLVSTTAPDSALAYVDLLAFSVKTVDTYYSTIRTEFDAVVSNQLYLGCMFNRVSDLAATKAAEYCDIVSYNTYVYSVKELALPSGSDDTPIMIGEFNFGAVDTDLFVAYVATYDQDDRVKCYTNFLHGALDNAAMVGTFWFMYRSAPASGRRGGEENYQDGFIDICDQPYPELRTSIRSISSESYSYRTTG